jgi:hypothetical protein
VTAPDLREQITEYTVSALPEDNVNAHLYEVGVAYRGDGRWAVTHLGYCLTVDGSEWDFNRPPSERVDEWLARFRFPTAEAALTAARKAVLELRVGGRTAAEVLAQGVQR